MWRERLQTLARHTSEKERRAEDAERELVQWKKVRFMANKVGDEFSGYVTGVTAFGLFVELVEQFVEGLVHISSIARFEADGAKKIVFVFRIGNEDVDVK